MDPLHIVCPHCDAQNRVPRERLSAGQGGKCGRCHQALFTGEPVALDGARLAKHVANSDIPVVVDFWAAWCGPCRVMSPILEELAAERPDLRVVKVDVDANQAVGARYGVLSMPTFMVFRDGEPVGAIVGSRPKRRLLEDLGALL